MWIADRGSDHRVNQGSTMCSMGFVPLPGMVGYGATVPRFRGGGSDPPGAPGSVILGGASDPPGASFYVNFLISPGSRCNSADSRLHVP
jgi:hypothetical protein